MKAITFATPGGPEVLEWKDVADQQAGPDELLVRVHVSAVNRADLLQRRGVYPPPPGGSPIIGLELAGEVVAPQGEFQAGDRVMAVVTGGGYAELAAVPIGMALRIPKELSFEQAGAIPEVFLTAYMNLFTFGRLQAGETALIHAGASGVGTAAIQLARAAGATVIATAGSDEKLARCRELGAAVAINYRQGAWAEQVRAATNGRGVDVILDFVGAPYWDANLTASAIGGRIMIIGFLGGARGQLDLGAILAKNLTITGASLRNTPLARKSAINSDFAKFALPRFASGELQPVIDRTFALRDAAAAHQYLETNQNIGKLVLRVER